MLSECEWVRSRLGLQRHVEMGNWRFFHWYMATNKFIISYTALTLLKNELRKRSSMSTSKCCTRERFSNKRDKTARKPIEVVETHWPMILIEEKTGSTQGKQKEEDKCIVTGVRNLEAYRSRTGIWNVISELCCLAVLWRKYHCSHIPSKRPWIRKKKAINIMPTSFLETGWPLVVIAHRNPLAGSDWAERSRINFYFF